MAEITTENTYELLKPWGFLVEGDKLTTGRGVGELLVTRGMARKVDVRGGADETNKAFQKPPKQKGKQ